MAGGPVIGTRSPLLVPRVAICDPDLARTLPRRLVAATGIDALSHCIEGYFAEPANPIVDALALDGVARAFTHLPAALEPAGDQARAELMAAAFAGGAAIHKGLGPAHAIAITCGDQNLHHGVLVAAALPHTVALVARHAPAKASRIAAAIGLTNPADLAAALRSLTQALGLPATYREAGYHAGRSTRWSKPWAAARSNRASALRANRRRVPRHRNHPARLTPTLRSILMRVVALEEHLTMPHLASRVSREAIVARGMTPPGATVPPAIARGDQLRDTGAGRIADMDAAGISVQVLSLTGPGAELLPATEGPALAQEMNDALAKVVAERPDRFAAFTHLAMTAPQAAADELERCTTEHGFPRRNGARHHQRPVPRRRLVRTTARPL